MNRTAAAIAIVSALSIATLNGGCTKTETTTVQETNSSSQNQAAANTQNIKVGQTVTVGDCELTVTGFEWCNEFKEGNVYVAASNVGGETLLRVTASVKNYSARTLNLRFGIKAPLVINSKYNVGSEIAPRDSIKSLDTVDVSFYYPMSNELRESFESGQVAFEFREGTTEKLSDAVGIDNLSDGTQIYYAKEVLDTYVLDITQ